MKFERISIQNLADLLEKSASPVIREDHAGMSIYRLEVEGRGKVAAVQAAFGDDVLLIAQN